MGQRAALLGLFFAAVASAGPIHFMQQLGRHADDVVKAMSQVEGIYRESQPRPASSTSSPTPSKSFKASDSSSPSITPRPSYSPSPTPSEESVMAPMAEPPVGEVLSRDVRRGWVMRSGELQHDDVGSRRYGYWLPNGMQPASLERKTYLWVDQPNRFQFLRNGTYSDYKQREYPATNTRSVMITDDPRHLLDLASTDQMSNDTTYVALRRKAVTEMVGNPVVTSRAVGSVYRYLGYVPVSRQWSGHPSLDTIPRSAPPCAFSRSYKCAPPLDFPTPTPTPTPTPDMSTPTPTPAPTPTPKEPEVDLTSIVLEPPPSFFTAPNPVNSLSQPALEEEPVPVPAVLPPEPPLPPELEAALEDEAEGQAAADTLGVPVDPPVTVVTTFVPKVVAGGVEATSDYSAASNNVGDPVKTDTHNTATKNVIESTEQPNVEGDLDIQ